MQQTTFKTINTAAAWTVFAIAATTYCLTTEPTASLWDCPEFIASGYKLEIGHPPGAPVYMLAANLFAQLASSPSQVALMVNTLSALLSAGCIFFLFLTITHFAYRLIVTTGTPDRSQVATIEACGLAGALAYTFSDTFWFSAVEAEVYAFSSFLTALMFWLILRWEREADQPRSDRWLILIAYVTGLSIGVHLLCLLCLPAMALVVYYRQQERPSAVGALKALAAGGLLVAIILYGVIPGVPMMGGWFELLFTNILGCPYNTGLACYTALLACALIVGLRKARSRLQQTSLACLLMILAGFSSYGVVFIRANANTPMCENAPGNIFALGSYLSREQYGDTPLLSGPAYCSEIDFQQKGNYMVPKQKEGAAVYRPSADSTKQVYELTHHRTKYLYKETMLFPRMHSARHAKAYEEWMGGVRKQDGLPTAAENLRFFLGYQVNFMYWRYFLWNFVGRQNNIQGHGEAEHGNWITGLRCIDDLLLGCDTSRMPTDLTNNKGHNVFYGLPLLLGLAGLVWQWRKGRKGRQQTFTIACLFVMTGLAIVVYLNQTPLQPRERDYAYAGSFYAFAVWIGLGVGAITSALQRVFARRSLPVTATAALLGLLVPLQMVSQTWDDHDRSGRYTCRDFGANYLQSMQREGHPIILTDGDNETFPLWYNQEVEGVRRDTRDCNLEYLQTDWYIDQMKRPAYDSPALPIGWQHKDYQEGRREFVPILPGMSEETELRDVISHWVLSDQADRQCMPTDSVTITSASGTMTLSFKGMHSLGKNDLMVLEMLSKADWQRPIYTSLNLGPDLFPYLRSHLVLEGLAYRISPTVTKQAVDVDRLYANVMHRFRWGNLSAKGIYVDEDVKRLANTHQFVMSVLIDSLLQQDDLSRAVSVCKKWQKQMPAENVPYTDAALAMARCYYAAGRQHEADAVVGQLLRRADEWLAWIDTIIHTRSSASSYSTYIWMKTMHQAMTLAWQQDRKDIMNQYADKYERYIKKYTKN